MNELDIVTYLCSTYISTTRTVHINMSLYYFGGGRRARTFYIGLYVLYALRAPLHILWSMILKNENDAYKQTHKISRISHLLSVWLLFYIAHVRTGAARGSRMHS